MIGKCQGVARLYLDRMGIADMAVFKACLFSLGMLFGMIVPKNAKKAASIVAGVVFVSTYVPLMLKLVLLVFPRDE